MVGLSRNSYLFPPVTSLYCVLLLLSKESEEGMRRRGVEKEKEKERGKEGKRWWGRLLNTQLFE